jgi:uncharacterized protein YmfQ (DUF2313 family)
MTTGWGYGPWGGGGLNPWGGTETRLHYFALKKIWPIKDLEGSFDDDLTIDGTYLDDVYYQDADLQTQIFPDTATSDSLGLLTSWECVFQLPGTGTDAQRQSAVVDALLAVVNKQGRLNKQFYIDLGAIKGYTVLIYESIGDMFIVASTSPPATQLPAPLYNASHIWIWTMYTYGILPVDEPAWEALINKYKPAFTQVQFGY